MYIIIEGTVKIYKNILNKKNDKNKEKLISENNLYEPNIKNINSIKESYYEKKTGNQLGFNQLKNKLSKRLFKAEAKTKCILGLLSKTDYTLIFERTDVLEKTSILYFLENLNVLQKFIGTYFFENFLSFTTMKRYNSGDIIIHKGDPFRTFYIIRSGIFSLSLFSNRKSLPFLDLTIIRKDNNLRFTTQRNFELKQSYIEEIEYKLFNLGPGEFFGDVEFNSNLSNYIFDVKCIVDKSEVFEMNMEKFKKEVPNFFLQEFKIESNKQLDLIKERIKEIKILQKKSMIKTRNKYLDAFIENCPKTYNKCVIEHNNDPYINCYVKPIKNKFHIRDLKMSNIKINLDNLHLKKKKKRPISYSPLTHFNIKNQKRIFSPQIKKRIKGFNFSSDSSSSTNSSKNKLKLSSSRLFLKSLSNYATSENEKKRSFSPSMSEKKLINFPSDKNIINLPLKQDSLCYHRIITEKYKSKFPKCIEINKQFYMQNNSKIIQKKIKKLILKPEK
jgi:CRP-like cAMP-binding protein